MDAGDDSSADSSDRTDFEYSLAGDSDRADLEWAVVHALVEANVQTVQTIENLYYHCHYADSTDIEMVRETLSEAIQTHAAIRDDLETVRELLDDIDQ